jgi:glycosyltransferase involved in cell wall biosynthesis
MRIAYLTLQAPREGEAAYVHVQEMVEGLGAIGCTVELFAPSYRNAWHKPLFPLRMVEHFLIQARVAVRLRAFDVLYVRAHFMALPIAVLASMMGVPVVHEVNGPYEDVLISYPLAAPFRWIIQWLQRAQYKLAQGLIAVTPQLKEWLSAQCGRVPITVVSNGANLEYFNPHRTPDQSLPRPYAVFVGGLAPWHGIKTLIEAVQHDEWPESVKLVIVGDGPEAGAVQRAVENTSRLVALGRRSYASIGSIIVGAVVGLVPISDPRNRSRTSLWCTCNCE